MLLEERLPEEDLLLLPLALGLLELDLLLLEPDLLLRPLEAEPRPLLLELLREEPDLEEEEEELRDAIACSFGALMERPSPVVRPRCSI